VLGVVGSATPLGLGRGEGDGGGGVLEDVVVRALVGERRPGGVDHDGVTLGDGVAVCVGDRLGQLRLLLRVTVQNGLRVGVTARISPGTRMATRVVGGEREAPALALLQQGRSELCGPQTTTSCGAWSLLVQASVALSDGERGRAEGVLAHGHGVADGREQERSQQHPRSEGQGAEDGRYRNPFGCRERSAILECGGPANCDSAGPPLPPGRSAGAQVSATEGLDHFPDHHRVRLHVLVDVGDVSRLLECLVKDDEERMRRLVRRELGDLGRDDRKLALVRETALAFMTSGYSVEATAERLFVHKNTVRYRHARAKELLGHPLTERTAQVELALRFVDHF